MVFSEIELQRRREEAENRHEEWTEAAKVRLDLWGIDNEKGKSLSEDAFQDLITLVGDEDRGFKILVTALYTLRFTGCINDDQLGQLAEALA